MTTVISNQIFVDRPTDLVVQYAKENLEFPNPDYIKKERMGFWTGRTPKSLRLYEWHGSTLVLPFGVCRDIMPMLKQGAVATDFRQDEEIDYGEPIPLYDYQEEAVQALAAAKYGILKAPAGCGKTQTALGLVKALKRRTLWLCHTHDLLNQSLERALLYMPEELTGTITEGKVNIGSGITFATVQTMCNADLLAYRDMWDVIIVDECHRISANATSVSRFQKVLNHLAARHKYGLTATPARSDGLIKATFALTGGIVHEVPEAAVRGRIMPVTVRPVETETDISDECLNSDGTINYTKLIGYLTEDEERNKQIARCIMDEKAHSCLILSDRIAHLEAIRGLLPYEMQEKSAVITGKMTSKRGKAYRQEAIEKMRTGEYQYLFATYSLAKEGLDVPRLDRLFMVTPVKFSSVVIQSIGRIARTFDGKGTPVAYDFVDHLIGFCERAFKERCRHYRKEKATIEGRIKK